MSTTTRVFLVSCVALRTRSRQATNRQTIPSTRPAATGSTTCCASTPPRRPRRTREMPDAPQRCSGCSPGTCTRPRPPAGAWNPPSGASRSVSRRRTVSRCRSPPTTRRWPGATPSTRTLVAAIGQAAATGHDDIGWQLPVTLTGFFGLRRRWADLQAATTIAVTCARRRGDQHGGLSLSSTSSAMPTASASSASCSGSARPRAAAAGSWVAIRPFWHHPHRVAPCPQHGGGDRIRSAAAGDAGSAGQRLQAGAVPGRTAGQPGRQHGLNRAVPQVTRPRGGRSEALSPLAQPSSPGVTIPATIRRSRIAGSRPRGGGRRCGLGWR